MTAFGLVPDLPRYADDRLGMTPSGPVASLPPRYVKDGSKQS